MNSQTDNQNQSPQLPGIFKLAWMLLMQPVTLHRHLKACGIDDPDAPIWMLWWAKENRTIKRRYARQILILVFITMPIVSFFLSLAVNDVFILLRYSINFNAWALGIVFGLVSALAFGMGLILVFGTVSGTVFSLSFGIGFSVALSAVFGLVLGIPVPDISDVHTVAGGPMGDIMAVSVIAATVVTFAIFLSGLFFCITFCNAFCAASGLNKNVAFCFAVASLFGAGFGEIFNLSAGLATASVFIIVNFRLPLYLLEALLQFFLYVREKILKIQTLNFIPVLYHELSFLPHPFLARHILLNAENDPALVRRVLDACAIAPGQQIVGQFALAHLQARELEKQIQQHDFANILELQGQWLPGVEGAASSLLALREVARYLNSAHKTKISYQRGEHLENADKVLSALENQLIGDLSFLGSALKNTLPAWKAVIAELRREVPGDLSPDKIEKKITASPYQQ